MTGAGTAINVVAILVGTGAGLGIGARLPERVRTRVFDGLGLLTLVIGVGGALDTDDFRPVLPAVVAGAVAGELLDLDARLTRLGEWIHRRVAAGSESPVAEAWVTTTLLFCVGPLSILGAFDDALRGDLDRLILKSGLDGVASLAFAASLGWGVLLSAGSVLVYQGTLTAAAAGLEPLLSGEMIDALGAAGGVLIVGLGLNLLRISDIRVANFLPALVFAPGFAALGEVLS